MSALCVRLEDKNIRDCSPNLFTDLFSFTAEIQKPVSSARLPLSSKSVLIITLQRSLSVAWRGVVSLKSGFWQLLTAIAQHLEMFTSCQSLAKRYVFDAK